VTAAYQQFSWARSCEEIRQLRLNMPDGDLLQLATASASTRNRWLNVVTPLGIEGKKTSLHGPDGGATSGNDSGGANPRGPVITTVVAKLATALADAVLSGDELGARRLALQIRGLQPDAMRKDSTHARDDARDEPSQSGEP
jgi:hypothetical protein